MAERLMRYYQWVAEKSGVSARTKLAMETKVPSTKAALEPDSPQNLALFAAAAQRIVGVAPPRF